MNMRILDGNMIFEYSNQSSKFLRVKIDKDRHARHGKSSAFLSYEYSANKL